MTPASNLPDLEARELAVSVNLASSVRLAIAIALDDSRVQQLLVRLRTQPSAAYDLVSYARQLAEQEFDPEFEAPCDVALFAALVALDTAAPQHSAFVAEIVSTARNLWWARQYSTSELRTAGRAGNRTVDLTSAAPSIGPSQSLTTLVLPTGTGSARLRSHHVPVAATTVVELVNLHGPDLKRPPRATFDTSSHHTHRQEIEINAA